MSKNFFKKYIIFSLIWLIILVFTPQRFDLYLSNISLIGKNILISIFPAIVFGWVTTFLVSKFIFKDKDDSSKIVLINNLILKRLLANIIDFAIIYLYVTIIFGPFIALYFSRIINAVVLLIILATLMTVLPIIYFTRQWKKGDTIGYKLLKIKLNFGKQNLFQRAILKVFYSAFTVFALIAIYISLVISEGKKDLLDSAVGSWGVNL